MSDNLAGLMEQNQTVFKYLPYGNVAFNTLFNERLYENYTKYLND